MHRAAREAIAEDLRDNAGLLAEAVVEAMRAARPDMFSRYGASGRRRCFEDTQFHLEHLAAALDVDDPGEFVAYRKWLSVVLGAHGVPEEDIDANFAAIASVLRERYGTSADIAVRLLASPLPEGGRMASPGRENDGPELS
jgi:MerR family transcriptional regulator, light-induced transcriptional regulator